MKPLLIDLFCGLGGWTNGFIAEGWDCVGFDIEVHDYGEGGYPGQLVLQDVKTISGSQFRDAACIVASPPCQNYSYFAMPWSRAKKMAEEIHGDYIRYRDLNTLFFECHRIQMEAIKAAGRYIPLVIENVRGAQPWVGPSKANFGSFHLWGDIAQVGKRIMRADARFGEMQYLNNPARAALKGGDRNKNRLLGHGWTSSFADSIAQKSEGQNWSRFSETGEVSPHWRLEAANGMKCTGQKNGEEYAMTRGPVQDWDIRPVLEIDSAHCDNGLKLSGNNSQRRWEDREAKRLGDATKTIGHANQRDGFSHTRHLTNQAESDAVDGRKQPGISGPRDNGKGDRWFQDGAAKSGSKSNARKAASAQIAQIPFALASHIARIFKP